MRKNKHDSKGDRFILFGRKHCDKINVAEIMISPSDRVENIVGKGENAGQQEKMLVTSIFSQCFQKLLSQGH